MKIPAYISLIVLIAASCTKKLVPENDTLYTGSTVKIENAKNMNAKQQKALKNELQQMIRPVPNTKFLGMRLKLAVYSWPLVGKRIGEPPVLTSSMNFQRNNEILQNRLENRGFFKAGVTWDSATKNRKTTGTFTARVEEQYIIRSISFPTDSSELSRNIAATAKESLLKTGVPYDLDVIKAERSRIDAALKNNGYYYFSPDYIIVNVDSTVGGNKVDLFLRVKPLTPDESRNIYHINEVTVHADYSLDNINIADSAKPDAIHNGYRIIDPASRFKPKIFERTMVIKPGDIYKRDDHNLSLNRLVNLGVYKFVKVQFENVPGDTAYLLNAYYYLTPMQRKSIRGEVGVLTRSSNTTGTELQVSWRHRNLFKGAEMASVSAFGGLERQVSGQQPASGINRFGFDINLIIPRISFPFRFNTSSAFVPQTRFNLGYEYFNRTTQYSMHSFKASSGYAWKEHITKEHQLNVLAINYVYPSKISDSFQIAIDTNLFLARSIQKQLIIGSNYNFNQNNQLGGRQVDISRFYFNINLDASGNILGLLMGASENNPKSILSVPFSQYIRGEIEIRKSFPFRSSKTNMLATRVIVGGGYAYGNSIALPFIKSFFIGGTNSIRAFRARSLGPGTFYGGNADTARRFLPDQPGDLKLEMNAELRFNITSIFNGALFVDAGNIWTLRKDPNRPGAEFTGKFLNQLAVGVGAGLRVDLSLIIIRGDVAFPVRKPFEDVNINFGSKDWRSQNIIFNLAIGYPF